MLLLQLLLLLDVARGSKRLPRLLDPCRATVVVF
jgi:hypothetical protein